MCRIYVSHVYIRGHNCASGRVTSGWTQGCASLLSTKSLLNLTIWPVSSFTTITVSLIIDDSFIWQQLSNQFVDQKSSGHVWCVHNYLKTKYIVSMKYDSLVIKTSSMVSGYLQSRSYCTVLMFVVTCLCHAWCTDDCICNVHNTHWLQGSLFRF